jgi:hypothetical protein
MQTQKKQVRKQVQLRCVLQLLCYKSGVVCLALLVAAAGGLSGCRTAWARTRDTTRTLSIAVQAQGAPATVSANGRTCGRAPTQCNLEVTESKVYHYSRDAWKAYLGYGALSTGPSIALIGLPVFLLSETKGNAVGGTLLGIGGLLVVGGAILLAAFYGQVDKKYKGIIYRPKNIFIHARTLGGQSDQRSVPTAQLVKDPRKPVRFFFSNSTSAAGAPSPGPATAPAEDETDIPAESDQPSI